MNVPKLKLGLAAIMAATVYLLACVLPGEPSEAEHIGFRLDFPQPYRVPLAGSGEPAITIVADGRVLQNATYRLESLDPDLVGVDANGRRLEGVGRGSASARVVYTTAMGALDTVFTVQVVVSRIAVSPPAMSLTQLGVTTQVSATAYDAEDAPVPNVAFTWSSADPQVAAVNETGLVRAVDEGTVAITAEADSVKALASVTVTQVAAAVRVAPELDTLRTVGRSVQFIALAFDSSSSLLRTARPRWTSTDSMVATVSAAGLATATGAGTARIIARVGTAADTATLAVAQVIRFIVVTPSYDTLTAIADTRRLVALAFDSLNFPIPSLAIGWATSDAAVATVDQAGLVRAAKNGVVLVTAASGGQSAFATVVVRQKVVAARIAEDNVTLTGAGATVRLSATGLDRNDFVVDGAVFTWRSSAGCVARVDDDGVVTARGGGRTDILAAPANGGIPDTTIVRVTAADEPMIAFASRRGIETICDDGSQRTLLIPFAQDQTSEPLMGDPSWSADGARIAFSRFEGFGQGGGWYREVPMTCRVYTAAADGFEPRALPLYPSQCNRYPAWSPDGQQIAFVWGRYCFVCADTWSISVVNADGSNLRELLPHTAHVEYAYPTWSPDGTKLAFQGSSDSGNVIMVINADGSGLTNLTAHLTQWHYDEHPAWSPDGSELAFVRDGDIWIMKADGSGARNLTSSPAIDIQPAWSPDGSRLVFVSSLDCVVGDWEGGEGGDCDLYVLNRDGTELRRVTSTAEWEIRPSWRRTAPQ
jgi:uncharacterized protein YjdB